ncbi:DUF2842 domain-containing protein [Sphingomicrobium flavum]|uniref:DUF2842 domain-containing protein n=1 Tax=Sphingomicrobium flavum TaxID=1229164 RepID=UPI0021AD9A62|nr:DUF2842 domain-containing protein [Sphingomicrobium flavum]
MYEPQTRNLIGMAGIMAWMIGWIAAIVTFSDTISAWPVLVQAVFYLVTGLIWILPLGRVMMWMATGSWKKPSGE